MKDYPRFIVFALIIFKYFSCADNFNQIFNDAYSKLSQLPDENTIYYSKDIKCSNANSNNIICLAHENLYKIEENNYQLLTNISDYSNKFYYELSLYKDDNANIIKCYVIYFKNQNELIFKYYQIDIDNNQNIYNEDYVYYNTSINPINSGINCHNNDTDNLFNCFYLNKNKEVIKIDININISTKSLTIKFQTININNNNDISITNNTIIMSSLYRNKFKFFSCFNYTNTDSFSIYIQKGGSPPGGMNGHRRNLQHGGQSNSNPSGPKNEIELKNFTCENTEKMILFSIFKDECPNDMNCINQNNLNKLDFSIFYEAKLNNNQQNPSFQLDIKNRSECTNLLFEENEKMFFFQFKYGNFDIENLLENKIETTSLINQNNLKISTIPYQNKNKISSTFIETTTNFKEIKTSEIPKETMYNKELAKKISNEITTNEILEEINSRTTYNEYEEKKYTNIITTQESKKSDFYKYETTTPQKINIIENILNEIKLENFNNSNYTSEEINKLIYEKIIENVIKNIEDLNENKEGIIIEGKDSFFYHITSLENDLANIGGKNNVTNQFSKIDLGVCEDILRETYKIDKNVSLAILKFEKLTTISSERNLQYEVYESNKMTKLM